jgi:hypothetical protein
MFPPIQSNSHITTSRLEKTFSSPFFSPIIYLSHPNICSPAPKSNSTLRLLLIKSLPYVSLIISPVDKILILTLIDSLARNDLLEHETALTSDHNNQNTLDSPVKMPMTWNADADAKVPFRCLLLISIRSIRLTSLST